MSKSLLAAKAKRELEEFVVKVDGKLAEYWEEEGKRNFGFNDKQKKLVRGMIEHAGEHNLRKAKRLRGAFVHYAFKLGGEEGDDRLWKAAMAIELVHTALLMHDDFMDEDEVRRGGPTTQKFYEALGGDKHYGESMAVTAGDMALCMGFELLEESGFDSQQVSPAMRQLLRGIVNTTFGQAYDVTLEAMKEWTEEDVIVLHRAKTAIYTYENPLFIGAHLAGLPEKAFTVLHDYAIDGGVAFQLQDDILGVYGDEEKTGKSADSDIRQGKCTLMIKRILDVGNAGQVAAVKKVWGNKQATREDLEAAKAAIKESGAYDYNKRLAKEYAVKAAGSAGKLRDLNLQGEAIDFIQGIAEYMAEREV